MSKLLAVTLVAGLAALVYGASRLHRSRWNRPRRSARRRPGRCAPAHPISLRGTVNPEAAFRAAL